MGIGNDGSASLHGVAIRVSALDSTGHPASGLPLYVTDALIKFDFNSEISTGPEVEDRNAGGALAVTYKQPDVVKRLTCALEIVNPDPELEVILTGGVTFVSGANIVGMQAPPVMTEGNPNGVGIEIWTRAIKNGIQVSDYPWFRWIFPMVKLHKSTRTIDVNRLTSPFDGMGLENPNFGTGPAHDIVYDTSRTWQVYRDTTKPASAIGAQKIT